jgi:hypothetical protein
MMQPSAAKVGTHASPENLFGCKRLIGTRGRLRKTNFRNAEGNTYDLGREK